MQCNSLCLHFRSSISPSLLPYIVVLNTAFITHASGRAAAGLHSNCWCEARPPSPVTRIPRIHISDKLHPEDGGGRRGTRHSCASHLISCLHYQHMMTLASSKFQNWSNTGVWRIDGEKQRQPGHFNSQFVNMIQSKSRAKGFYIANLDSILSDACRITQL